VGANSNGQMIATSADGINWTQVTLSVSYFNPVQLTNRTAFPLTNIAVFGQKQKPCSLEWTGTVFVLTVREEITWPYSRFYSYNGTTWNTGTGSLTTNPMTTRWTGTRLIEGTNVNGPVFVGNIISGTSTLNGIDFSGTGILGTNNYLFYVSL
jgi:hypothetical protein